MKTIALALLLFILVVPGSFAQDTASVTALGNHTASSQVTCTASATALYSTTTSGGTSPYGRLSLTFQNQSAQPVYIAPRSDISTSNAGVLLPQYSSFTTDRTSGNVSWYCVTSSGSATVGITEEK